MNANPVFVEVLRVGIIKPDHPVTQAVRTALQATPLLRTIRA